jgi:hypothetical protein
MAGMLEINLMSLLRRPRTAWRGLASIVIAAMMTGAPPTHAQMTASENPDAVQAAFLFNFAKFTTWPSISDLDTSIKFCIQNGTLDPAVFAGWGKKRVQNRPVRVVFFNDAGEIGLANCSIMFIGQDMAAPEYSELLSRARAQSTLLVSNVNGFSDYGGHIELYIANRRLRFKVNLDELLTADLALGAGVLNLAEIVETTGRAQ